MIVMASANRSVLDRWADALPRGSVTVKRAEDMTTLEGVLAGRRPEVLLLDFAFPELGGLTGLKDLQAFSPETRVLVLAAEPDDDEGIEVLRVGARGYCNLYIRPDLLQKAVAAVTEGEVWVGRRLVDRLIEFLGRMVDAPPMSVRAPAERLEGLTRREREIALMVANGANNRTIAEHLEITERTVKAHLGAVFDKVGVHDRLQLALYVNGYYDVDRSGTDGG